MRPTTLRAPRGRCRSSHDSETCGTAPRTSRNSILSGRSKPAKDEDYIEDVLTAPRATTAGALATFATVVGLLARGWRLKP